MAKKKVQIQLLNENTGAVIEDVDPLTSADAVTFTDGETFQQKYDSGKLRGQTGATGAAGAKGATGTPFTPSVSSTGVLSWTNNGSLANPASVNIKGPQGERGLQGIQGPAGTQGAKGETGARGANGTTFTPTVSSAGVLSWSNNGGLNNPTSVNIKGPQGERGATGAQGPQGVKGDAGTQGPRGLQGATGPQGPKGDKGDTGETVRVGTSYNTAQQVKLFFKVVP